MFILNDIDILNDELIRIYFILLKPLYLKDTQTEKIIPFANATPSKAKKLIFRELSI